MEHALRKFTVLTVGQRIPIIHDGRVYPLKVEEVKPSPAAHLIDTNLQVEFTAHDETKVNEDDDIQGMINGNKTNNDEEKKDEIEDDHDRYAEVEQVTLYTTITNIAKSSFVVFYVYSYHLNH